MTANYQDNVFIPIFNILGGEIIFIQYLMITSILKKKY